MGKPQLTMWLIKRLDEKGDKSACWLNRNEYTFKILWTHKSKHNWTPEEGQIFMDWAIYTNKNLKNNVENHSTWKTRMRCAISKSKEIHEIKDTNYHPYKVFKIIKKDFRKKFVSTINNNLNLYNNQKTDSGIPTVVKEYEESESLPIDLESISTEDMIYIYDIEVKILINNTLTQKKNLNTILIQNFIIYPTFHKNSFQEQECNIEMREPQKFAKYLQPFYSIQFCLTRMHSLAFMKTSSVKEHNISIYRLRENLADLSLPEAMFVNEEISNNTELTFIIAEKPPFKYKLIKIILAFKFNDDFL